MGINAKILGNNGRNYAKIGDEGELSVVVHPHPPINEKQVALPFRRYFTDNGDSTGDSDMRVNGSLSAPIPFYIEASNDHDIYINSISVEIADAGAVLNRFGNINALTNGIEFSWSSLDSGKIVLHEGLKSNYSFVRLSGGQPAFGTGNSAFKANNVSGTSEAYISHIDFSDVYGLQWGVRLRKGTKDKISFIIKDDITGIDSFNMVAYGITI